MLYRNKLSWEDGDKNWKYYFEKPLGKTQAYHNANKWLITSVEREVKLNGVYISFISVKTSFSSVFLSIIKKFFLLCLKQFRIRVPLFCLHCFIVITYLFYSFYFSFSFFLFVCFSFIMSPFSLHLFQASTHILPPMWTKCQVFCYIKEWKHSRSLNFLIPKSSAAEPKIFVLALAPVFIKISAWSRVRLWQRLVHNCEYNYFWKKKSFFFCKFIDLGINILFIMLSW